LVYYYGVGGGAAGAPAVLPAPAAFPFGVEGGGQAVRVAV